MTDHPNRIASLLNVTSTPMAGRLRDRLLEPPGARASVPRLWASLRARRPLWDPLATVLVAVAVAIVGVVVLRGGALVNLRCPCSF